MTTAHTAHLVAPGTGARDRSVDVLKGIGIVIIVMGHMDYSALGGGFVSYLYTFNVALFFVVAGYTWRAKPGQPLWAGILVKFRTIYLPYVVLFAISLLYGHLVVRYVWTEYVIPFEWGATLRALLFASDWLNTVPTFNFALWFLPIFFLSSVAFSVLQKIPNRWAWGAVVLALALVSLPFQELLPGRPIVNINVLPVGLVLMACGYLLKKYLDIASVNVFALIALFGFTLWAAFNHAGNISAIGSFWFYPLALGSFVLYLRLAHGLRSSTFLLFIGTNSLIMFGIHGLVGNTYLHTHIQDYFAPEWSGLMLYLINLAYTLLATYSVVLVYRYLKERVLHVVHRRTERRRAPRLVNSATGNA